MKQARHQRRNRRQRNERGHLMAGLVAATAVLVIMSTVAFQEWGQVLRRDKEAEMIFRAQEIVRAIQRYRVDHGGQAPVEMKLLLEPGTKGQYYIRQLYEDPLVLDGKWGLLYAGPGGTIIDPNAEEGRQTIAGLGGVGQPSGSGLQGGSSLLNPSDAREQQAGQDQQQPGGSTLSSGAASGSTGLPIAGVRTLSMDRPFRVYNGMTEYNQWLFTYLDLEGQQGQPGAAGNRPIQGNQPGGGPGQPGNTLRPGNQRPGQPGQQRPRRPGRGRPGQRPNTQSDPR